MFRCISSDVNKENIIESIFKVAAYADRENISVKEIEVSEDVFNTLGRPSFITTYYGEINIRTKSDGRNS